jgi:hypothetical protein
MYIKILFSLHFQPPVENEFDQTLIKVCIELAERFEYFMILLMF